MKTPMPIVLCYLMVDERQAACPHEVKIGKSGVLPKRSKGVAGSGSVRYCVLASYPGGAALEALAHKELAAYRTDRGEWFLYVEPVRQWFLAKFPKTDLPLSPYGLGVLKRDVNIRRDGNPGGKVPKGKGWKDTEGVLAKWLIYLEACAKAGGDATLLRTTQWAQFGITESSLENTVQAFLPGFFERYPRRRGQCYNRLYYMFNDKDKKTGKNVKRLSAEHPNNSEPMRAHSKVAEAIYRRGKPVSEDEVRSWFQA